jgi:hypothetical protein
MVHGAKQVKANVVELDAEEFESLYMSRRTHSLSDTPFLSPRLWS